MFGSLLRPTLDFVGGEGQQVVLKARKRFSTGRETAVRVRMPDGTRSDPIKVYVTNCRALTNGGYAVSGRLSGGYRLSGVSEPAQSDDDSLRSAPRLDCHLCVLSKDLPGFRAVTTDFSRGGLQIELQSPVEVGQRVLMKLDFETRTIEPLECRARIAWSAPKEAGTHRVGLQFIDLSPEDEIALQQYQRILERRDDSHIMHRLLFGNDFDSFEGPALPIHVEEEVPQVAASIEQVLEGTHQGRIEGYHRANRELHVFLRKSNGDVGEYVFANPRGMTDFFGLDDGGYLISHIRVKSSAAGAKRFQFVDSGRQMVLEVVAARCEVR